MTDAPTPAPHPDVPQVPPTPPPRKPFWPRNNWKLGCLILLLIYPGLPTGYIFVVSRIMLRDIHREVDQMRETLAKDAEGENQFHAWAVQVGQTRDPSGASGFCWSWDHSGKTWAFTPNYRTVKEYEERLPHSPPPPVLPTPFPAAMEEVLFLTVDVVRSMKNDKPRTEIRIHNRSNGYITFHLTDEYLDNAPPPAAAFRDVTPQPNPKARGFVNRLIHVAPGFWIYYGVPRVG